ncbi:aldehyde dehydrogenase family protein [Suttonella sp. R2A3]|uniref:aldehyde dehydrogenase family protein n=1 Tax=Suttonella sp. R2A3 TaxID=2908648 RepID=UPI001F2A5C23|nr:aldehyde dehydrogenase family protein [Suttonella sp. R2A3]UJF24952.1 aldehyde dehydrogenase family protein [Suttonella sp. R2A3]
MFKHTLTQTEIEDTLAKLRGFYQSGQSKPLAWRLEQLKALARMLDEQEAAFTEALKQDLGKAACESALTEIGFVASEIRYTLKHLKKWLKPKRVRIPLSLQPASGRLIYEPLGTVLIIAPWNYPLMLLLSPLVGALAAGNTALLKPSEHAPNVARLCAELLPKYLDQRAIAVIITDGAGSAKLLEARFDHIFYTGGAAVAQKVMAAAARHLTPVTLELGGKSPLWIDGSVHLENAAYRIAWAKWLNAGQTCVAPDYILTTEAMAEPLIAALKKAVVQIYSEHVRESADYGRIIHEQHLERLKGLLTDVDPQQVVLGGEIDAETRYIAPTIVDRVLNDAQLMQEEIFGPILPIVRVADVDEAIAFINAREKPLALYVFSDDEIIRTKYREQTSSGALCFNIAVAHLSAPELPFGGVGQSGFGRYMGRYSLETFSHQKPIMSKPLWLETMRWIAPPYNRLTQWVIKHIVNR